MIYLEGDVQVYSNIDDLFDFNDGYIYAPRQPWPEFLMWPTEFGTPKPSYYFNASMFVFEPGAPIFNDLLVLLNIITSIPLIPLDAQLHVLILLNKFFWKKLMGLPEHNYMALTMLQNHNESVDLNDVKVIHYCSPELRPWRFTPERVNVDVELVNKLKEKWLCICQDESLKPNKKQKSLEIKTEIKRSTGQEK
ncbi:hypothetical protein SLEP1_g14051 [Rubroshorea leprosula]|uniref:Hexosyltransferase n=1 Tax=Rubroshorea leprosula TaxID=152421 RepID=A0AAV5IS98_9ROSI|nr:hypothetical protein SLEP1_g14051 [Rubroshorea leprosula]